MHSWKRAKYETVFWWLISIQVLPLGLLYEHWGVSTQRTEHNKCHSVFQAILREKTTKKQPHRIHEKEVLHNAWFWYSFFFCFIERKKCCSKGLCSIQCANFCLKFVSFLHINKWTKNQKSISTMPFYDMNWK